jgi:hypothetical protein
MIDHQGGRELTEYVQRRGYSDSQLWRGHQGHEKHQCTNDAATIKPRREPVRDRQHWYWYSKHRRRHGQREERYRRRGECAPDRVPHPGARDSVYHWL